MKLKFNYKCDLSYFIDTENMDVLRKVTRKLKNNAYFLEPTLDGDTLSSFLNDFIAEGIGAPVSEIDGRLNRCHIYYYENQYINISGELSFSKTVGEYSIVESFYAEGFEKRFTDLLYRNDCFVVVSEKARRNDQFEIAVKPKVGTISCRAVLEE